MSFSRIVKSEETLHLIKTKAEKVFDFYSDYRKIHLDEHNYHNHNLRTVVFVRKPGYICTVGEISSLLLQKYHAKKMDTRLADAFCRAYGLRDVENVEILSMFKHFSTHSSGHNYSVGQAQSYSNDFIEKTTNLCTINHPNLIRIYQTCYSLERSLDIGFFMEKIDQENFTSISKQKEKLDLKSVFTIVIQLASAVEVLTKKNLHGIYPLDLEKIFVEKDTMKVKLLYGIDPHAYETGTIFGSGLPNIYPPPEIVMGKEERSKFVYEVASIFYLLATGKQLIDLQNDNICSIFEGEDPQSLSDLLPDVPIELSNLLASATRTKKEERLEDIFVFKSSLVDLYREYF